jgi:hypothetical protein
VALSIDAATALCRISQKARPATHGTSSCSATGIFHLIFARIIEAQQRQEELHLVAERFAHDAHRILAWGRALAFVRDELFLDEGLMILNLRVAMPQVFRRADSIAFCFPPGDPRRRR